ncbi:MAG: DUF979 domain-containing protein [Lacunisphaera sp.]
MKALLTTEVFYVIVGVSFALVAWRIGRDRTHARRWGSALFWALLAVTYLFGKVLPPLAVGYLILGMVGLAAARQVRKSADGSTSRERRTVSAEKFGNRLFWPALLVPATAVAGSMLFGKIHFGSVAFVEPKQVALIALGLGALAATAAALRVTHERPATATHEGGRLLQAIGWALILPQLLAALGGVFGAAKVGDVVAQLVAQALPVQIPFVAVAAYALGMALFTICLGNAFAAFPVMTLGVGLPLIVQQHHGNVAIMAAIGMLSGYCGTLLTPMAANFNLVPAMLLELKDRNAVIKAQAPMAGLILAANVLLMYFLVYRF